METGLCPRRPAVAHVFGDGDEVTGIIDWSGAARGDAMFDLAILTMGHPEHLGGVVAGYGADVDLDMIRAWWSFRCLEAGPMAGRARLRPARGDARGGPAAPVVR
jgi:aminoglycoside phosphotransferase (APT) family kinase protein